MQAGPPRREAAGAPEPRHQRQHDDEGEEDPVVNDGEWGPEDPTNGVYGGSQQFPLSNGHKNDAYANPSTARLANAGLFSGGMNSPIEQNQAVIETGYSLTGGVPTDRDWRVRLSLPPGSPIFYQDGGDSGALWPLVESGINGVVFPYTPQITVTHTANYTPQKLTHHNYTNYFYDNSEVNAISITGDFTVQSVDEGQYLLASIYFFRSLTKMFFGADFNAGNPPPLVYLNGYGQYYLPNVPCVVTSFQHTMPGDVDYMDIPEPAITQQGYNPQFQNYRLNSTRLPTTSQITLGLQPVYSRLAQSQGFSLNDFASGALINPPGSGLPASGFGASQGARYVGGSNTSNGGFL